MVIIADQYRNLDGLAWKTDSTGSAAIWACGKHPLQDFMEDPGDTFVRAKISGMYFYICYMPLSMSQEEFEGVLDRLVDDTDNRSLVAIADDFNVWTMEWGSSETKKRGQALLKAFFLLDLTLLNFGKKPMFVNGEASSMIHFTFVNNGLGNGNNCWEASEIYTQSDHRAITWRVRRQPRMLLMIIIIKISLILILMLILIVTTISYKLMVYYRWYSLKSTVKTVILYR